MSPKELFAVRLTKDYGAMFEGSTLYVTKELKRYYIGTWSFMCGTFTMKVPKKICERKPPEEIIIPDRLPRPDKEIPQSKQELLDCIHNLIGVFDNPAVRLKYHNSFTEEAVQIGRQILESNGITKYQ